MSAGFRKLNQLLTIGQREGFFEQPKLIPPSGRCYYLLNLRKPCTARSRSNWITFSPNDKFCVRSIIKPAPHACSSLIPARSSSSKL
jgi:hypothetical protein